MGWLLRLHYAGRRRALTTTLQHPSAKTTQDLTWCWLIPSTLKKNYERMLLTCQPASCLLPIRFLHSTINKLVHLHASEHRVIHHFCRDHPFLSSSRPVLKPRSTCKQLGLHFWASLFLRGILAPNPWIF